MSEGKVCRPPGCDRFAVCWQSLKLSKWGVLPVWHWAEKNRNHTGFFLFMPLHCSHHFFAVGGRIHEIRADQQKNDVGSVQVLLNGVFPFCSRMNLHIIPENQL